MTNAEIGCSHVRVSYQKLKPLAIIDNKLINVVVIIVMDNFSLVSCILMPYRPIVFLKLELRT